jgi:hypothetical protein
MLIAIAVCACSRDPGSRAPRGAEGTGAIDATALARAEFEVVSDELSNGTSKRYSRADFLPLDDARGWSSGDFIGRLRALFGPVAGDSYCLRHRATGHIITAYSAQSGPSYGGGSAAAGDDPRARIAADPVLAAGRPIDAAKLAAVERSPDDLRALRAKDHAWQKRLADALAPPGFPAVAARLDELVSAVRPADWEAIRYWGEDPTVYRVGASNGEAFEETFSVPDGLGYLLAQAERDEPTILDTSGHPTGAVDQLVDYWIYHHAADMVRYDASDDRVALRREALRALEDALPRVQAAWFRQVAAARAHDADYRDAFLELAATQIDPLRLDPDKARAALRAAAAP